MADRGTYRVVFEAIVEADTPNEADDEARSLIRSGRFEASIIEPFETPDNTGD